MENLTTLDEMSLDETHKDRTAEINDQLLNDVASFLTSDGIEYFKELKEEHDGEIPLVISYESKGMTIPHSIHFNEGMQVRNFLRSLDQCKDWTCHELDNTWLEIVDRVVSR